MSEKSKEVTEVLELNIEQLKRLFGTQDKYLRRLEDKYHVSITSRNGKLQIKGNDESVQSVVRVIHILCDSEDEKDLEEQQLDYAISVEQDKQNDAEVLEDIAQLDKECICHTISGKPICPKTLGQKRYVEAMQKQMIVFGLGPAGTGKTYLAMAMAIYAFKTEQVSRIILTRPAIEAGEKLGFLPGDLQSKVDPYLRPLYDALYQIMGADSFQKNMEKGLIEVAPLAYMRGRTLDNAFIILDEAQNTTPAQMKMFLTRIGFGSKVVITGDGSQKDLAPGIKSGLDEAVRVLSGVEEIAFCKLTNKDVVRHPLVQKIVKAYDDYEAKEKSANRKTKRQRNS